MAVRAADQLSIVDLTDAYSVILTSEAHTFPGTTNAAKAGSCTTQVIAMRGNEQIPASVNLSSVTNPDGITVTSDNHAMSPTLTITASQGFTTAGVVHIPVVVDSDFTIEKDFSVAIAFTGDQGTPGLNGEDGVDAVTVTVTSSNGTIFKNSAIATTLIAHVYKAGVELDSAAIAQLGTIKWYRDGGDTAVATGNSVNISAGDVTNKATYLAQLEG